LVLLTMRIHIRAAKRWEFLQTAESVLTKLKETDGCVSCNFYQDYEDEHIFCFVQEWKSRRLVEEYLRSNDFGVLRGAAEVLSEPVELKLDITQGHMETVNAIRAKGGN